MGTEQVRSNFLEIEDVTQANSVDMRVWKFITYDGGKYVFARRVKPLGP